MWLKSSILAVSKSVLRYLLTKYIFVHTRRSGQGLADFGKAGNLKMTKYQHYFNVKFAEIEANMATKVCIEKLHDTIKSQDEKIDVLE